MSPVLWIQPPTGRVDLLSRKRAATLNNPDKRQESKRTWWVVEFDVGPEQEDMVSWLMIHLGANGCQLASRNDGLLTLQASFEPGVIAADRLEPIYAALDEYGLAPVGSSLRINQIQEEDWLSEWKKGLQPLKLGERFIVSPPWFENQISSDDLSGRHIIWIEPGMAFGTGFHYTTQFCLKAIEKHLQEGRLLDVGTGSGILAIAAAQLFPGSRICALETDPLACRVARENIALNRVENQITLLEGSTEEVRGQKFDAILANLTCEDNLALLSDYAGLLSRGGLAVMTGILLEKLPVIESGLDKHGFRVVEKEAYEIWAGIVVERQ
jgi:ribosomal protein L11 methyltransferase